MRTGWPLRLLLGAVGLASARGATVTLSSVTVGSTAEGADPAPLLITFQTSGTGALTSGGEVTLKSSPAVFGADGEDTAVTLGGSFQNCAATAVAVWTDMTMMEVTLGDQDSTCRLPARTVL